MKIIKLVEASQENSIELPLDVARWLGRSRIAKVTPGIRTGTYDIQVGNLAGNCRYRDFQFEISPKISTFKLTELLVYSATGHRWQGVQAGFEKESLSVLVADYYSRLLEQVISKGLPKGYRQAHRTENQFRGKLLIDQQLRRHFMQIQPLEIETSELTVDTDENRVLFSACLKLMPIVESEAESSRYARGILSKLKAQAFAFSTVSKLTYPVPKLKKTQLNYWYFDALQLASQVLDNQGVGIWYGTNAFDGLLIQMWKVFESVVGRALTERFGKENVDLQYSTELALHSNARIRPDIVVRDSGKVLAALDTKYKSGSMKNEDIYQAIAYATVFGLDEATLVYSGQGVDQYLEINGPLSPNVQVRYIDLHQPLQKIIGDTERLVPILSR